MTDKLNLIFLDFDGVLNSERSNVAYTAHQHGNIGWKPEGLDEVAVLLVKRLAVEGQAKVVISSSWREFFPDEQLAKFLAKKGWHDCPIIGRTPKLNFVTMYSNSYSGSFRGNEVAAFLEDFVQKGNEVGTWVILDDSKDFHYGETAMGGFRSKQPVVNTDARVGFSLKNFYDALKILDPSHTFLDDLEMRLLP